VCGFTKKLWHSSGVLFSSQIHALEYRSAPLILRLLQGLKIFTSINLRGIRGCEASAFKPIFVNFRLVCPHSFPACLVHRRAHSTPHLPFLNLRILRRSLTPVPPALPEPFPCPCPCLCPYPSHLFQTTLPYSVQISHSFSGMVRPMDACAYALSPAAASPIRLLSLPLPVLYVSSFCSAGASSQAPVGWAAARVAAVHTLQASLK